MNSSRGIAKRIGFELLCVGCLVIPMALLNGLWMGALVGVLYVIGLLVIPAVSRITLMLGVRIERDRRLLLRLFIDAQHGTPMLCIWMGLSLGANYGWIKGISFAAVAAALFYPFHIWSAFRGRRLLAMSDQVPTPVLVFVDWLDGPDGIRPVPPRYVSVSRFSEEAAASGAWSVVLEFSEVPISGPTEATASFLFAEGPSEWLKPGVEFEMLAGSRVTATVRVI